MVVVGDQIGEQVEPGGAQNRLQMLQVLFLQPPPCARAPGKARRHQAQADVSEAERYVVHGALTKTGDHEQILTGHAHQLQRQRDRVDVP